MSRYLALLSLALLLPLEPLLWDGPGPGSGARASEISLPDGKAGNQALLLTDEKDVLDARWHFARRAREKGKPVIGISYAWDSTKVGLAALVELKGAAVESGAPVRLMIDGFGPSAWKDQAMDKAWVKALAEAGVEIRIFNPPKRESHPGWKQWLAAQRRSHEKCFVYGDVLGVGDRNMQNVNFRMSRAPREKGVSYRSVEAYFRGPVVEDARAHLEELWDSGLTRAIDTSDVDPQALARARKEIADYARHLDRLWNRRSENLPNPAVQRDNRLVDLVAERAWEPRFKPVESAAFVHDGLRAKGKVPGTQERVLSLLGQAKHKLGLHSPYLLMTPEASGTLRDALDRGAELSLVSAAPETLDSKAARAAAYAFAVQSEELMERGARIHLHEGPDMMHAKVFRADDDVTAIVSDNLDALSRNWNYESGVVVKDRAFAAQIDAWSASLVRDETRPLSVPARRGLAERCRVSAVRRTLPLILKGFSSLSRLPR